LWTTFNLAISFLRAAVRRGKLLIVRCKDRLNGQSDSGYRDIMLNVAVPESLELVGELQLSLRRLVEIKKRAHTVYEVERVLEVNGGDDELGCAVEGPGLESEQALRLVIVDTYFWSVSLFQDALERVLPRGCQVANVYNDGSSGEVRVRLGFDDITVVAALRDIILGGSILETALNKAVLQWRRPATDEELGQLGFVEVKTNDGSRSYYCRRTDAPWERPTIPVTATMRPATDDELKVGFDEFAAVDGRKFHIHRNASAAMREYDDGEMKSGVARDLVREVRGASAAPAATAAPAGDLAVGDAIEAQYNARASYYTGKITAVTGGTYSIEYDDGDKESGVARYLIRKLRYLIRDLSGVSAVSAATVTGGMYFLDRPTIPVPATTRPATDDDLKVLGYEKTVATDGRRFYFHPAKNEAQWGLSYVDVPATTRPATDDDLKLLGLDEFVAVDGRKFYVYRNASAVMWELPTVPATTRPATEDDLKVLGLDELVAVGGRKFYVHRNASAARWERPTTMDKARWVKACDPKTGHTLIIAVSCQNHPRKICSPNRVFISSPLRVFVLSGAFKIVPSQVEFITTRRLRSTRQSRFASTAAPSLSATRIS
jgi:hypothetical protein